MWGITPIGRQWSQLGLSPHLDKHIWACRESLFTFRLILQHVWVCQGIHGWGCAWTNSYNFMYAMWCYSNLWEPWAIACMNKYVRSILKFNPSRPSLEQISNSLGPTVWHLSIPSPTSLSLSCDTTRLVIESPKQVVDWTNVPFLAFRGDSTLNEFFYVNWLISLACVTFS